jgi:hypothetical protein
MKSTSYSDGREIKIPFYIQFEVTNTHLVISGGDSNGNLKTAKIFWE